MSRKRKPTRFYVTSSFSGGIPIETAMADVFAYVIEKRLKSSVRTFDGSELTEYNESRNPKEEQQNGTAA